MESLIGIDIGGTKCAVIRGLSDGSIEKKIKIPTTTFKETLAKIFTAVDQLGACDAIGISCGGPLDEKNGVILSPPNLPGWDNVHIVEFLKKKYGVPVELRNDANACALAEWRFGAGVGTENMVFITFGTGLGAGLIIGGRLYGGSTGMAGEVGHIRLSEHGPSGYGKVGSFEGFCSGGGLYELGRTLAREYIQRGVSPTFIKYGDIGSFTVAEMADAARAGDECALEVFEICSTMLGRGLATICDILDPELIIIGSVFARCRDLLEENTIRTMKKETLSPIFKNVKITVPKFGESIGDAAALAVAADILEQEASKR